MKDDRGYMHPSQSGINLEARHQLITLARRSRARITEFRRDRPTDWRPKEVRNPDGLIAPYFTDGDAWEFIASRLERGEQVQTIELDTPKGATGYVMIIDLEPNVPFVYVKLQLGSGMVIGRSFHYSTHGRRRPPSWNQTTPHAN